MRTASKGKSLPHQPLLVESSFSSSDTLIPSTSKDADGTQELKLKIYEVAGLTDGTSLQSFGLDVLFISGPVESSKGL